MDSTFDRSVRSEQKKILKNAYSDYDAKRHDTFVFKYNADLDKKNTERYNKNRGN